MHKKLFLIGTLLMICSHKSLSMEIKELLNTNVNDEIKHMVLHDKHLFFLYKNDLSFNAVNVNASKEASFKNCRIFGDTIMLNLKLGINKAIYHLAEPFMYQNKFVLPIANKNNVFLVETSIDSSSAINCKVFKNIITHNTDIFSLYSCGQSIISSSIYPSMKIWQYNQTILKEIEHSYVGGLCLGSNNSHSNFYMFKDTYERTIHGKWQRWRNSQDKKTIDGYFAGFKLKLDNDKKLTLNETLIRKEQLSLNLKNPENILFATYTKTEPEAKVYKNSNKIDIDGILLYNNNIFYLCGTHRSSDDPYFNKLIVSDKSTIPQDVKQMLFFAYDQQDKNNFYCITMADKNINIYSLVDFRTKNTLIEDDIRNNTTIVLKEIKTIPAKDIVTKFQKMTFDKYKNILYIAATNKDEKAMIYKIDNFISNSLSETL